MTKIIRRREFIMKSAQGGIASLAGGSLVSSLMRRPHRATLGEVPRIVVVQGEDYLRSTYKAIELWGGIGGPIAKNSRVAIVPNSQSKHPGAFTKPEIVRAAIRSLKDAGATEINCLSWLPARYWEDSGIGRAIMEEGAHLIIIDSKDEGQFSNVPIPHGKALKEAKLIKALSEHDIFVNLPIMKDHVGNKFTGSMKNLMGLNSPAVNQFFHTGTKTKPDNIEHLDQCIADLNLVCKPALCIVDATECISTNGPFGPGKIVSPRKVIVGSDRIALDSYCASLLGMEGEDILMIKRGFEHGLGEIDLKKIRIQEVRL